MTINEVLLAMLSIESLIVAPFLHLISNQRASENVCPPPSRPVFYRTRDGLSPDAPVLRTQTRHTDSHPCQSQTLDRGGGGYRILWLRVHATVIDYRSSVTTIMERSDT